MDSKTGIKNGGLWGSRARDWATLQEIHHRPLFENTFHKVGIKSGLNYLDVGCGAGLSCQLASEIGANIFGLDASQELISIARERVPDGNFQVGELELLPYKDESFDIVTGFNSFQYASNPIQALKEAKRVTHQGGVVVIGTWGRIEDCEGSVVVFALRSILPPPQPNAPGPFALADENILRNLAKEAGLTPLEIIDVECPFIYPDLEAAVRASSSSGIAEVARQLAGEEAVDEAFRRALEPFKITDGKYIMKNRFRYLTSQV